MHVCMHGCSVSNGNNLKTAFIHLARRQTSVKGKCNIILSHFMQSSCTLITIQPFAQKLFCTNFSKVAFNSSPSQILSLIKLL